MAHKINPKKRLRSEADKLFHDVCMKLNGRCFLCYGLASQVHHFKPKGSYGILRYEISNGIPLCQSCHFKLTFSDSSLQAKIAEIKGLKWFRRIEKMAKGAPASYQTIKWYQDNIKYLQKVLKKLC